MIDLCQPLARLLLQANASEQSASAAAGSAIMRSSAAEHKADLYEEHLGHASQVVDQLKEGIGSLFEAAVGFVCLHCFVSPAMSAQLHMALMDPSSCSAPEVAKAVGQGLAAARADALIGHAYEHLDAGLKPL